jgi:DNA (cytosine-5)-methyltransferase 1
LTRRHDSSPCADRGQNVICFERNTPDGHARIVGDIAPTLNRMGGGQREPCIMSTGQGNAEITEGHAPTLNCNHEAPILALAGNTIGRKPENGGNGCGYQEDVSYTLTKTDEHGIMQGSSVRRLTPRECERLQGFPDDWTRIPWRGASEEDCPDGPRYKACGNSMAVPVMRWIGQRIKDAAK